MLAGLPIAIIDMRPSPYSVCVALLLGACASAGTVAPASGPVPSSPSPATPTGPAPAAPPRAAFEEPPQNWHLLDPTNDRVAGISLLRAERELLAGRQPQRTITVAVIDNGVDTTHADLRANLWLNARETAGNRIDDERNGFVDDLRGWNLLGGPDGRQIDWETLEVTRLFKQCVSATPPASPSPGSTCDDVRRKYEAEQAEVEQNARIVNQISDVMSMLMPILKSAVAPDSVSPARVRALQPANPQVGQAKEFYLQLASAGVTPEEVEEQRKLIDGMRRYWLDTTFNPRPIVGDDPANVAHRSYGNADVIGPDADHGTHVAGIIGAVRGNGIGVDGIAPMVRMIAVRAVPNGDERDKDVANAIRYAVDAGAQIINMSFGKAFSPQKAAVDDAVRYAESRGVLLVHGAGNDGENVDSAPNFPTPAYLGGGRAANWIEVGASSWKGADTLVASFSNYGQRQVDVFAPGVDIYSSVTGNKYKRESGTSMASPVVAGVAAFLMAYYPTLTATDVRRIILASASRWGGQVVLRPGEGDARVPFANLSVTGGVVNVYNAVKMAEEMAKGR
jgi:subtilisin family serine protease